MLSSVAYGPEAILVVLAAAGLSALKYTMPITIAIVVLPAVLATSYRQVIEAFPSTSAGWCWTGPIRNGPDNVVICRMRFRPTTWSAN